jgi:hypothetical protein
MADTTKPTLPFRLGAGMILVWLLLGSMAHAQDPYAYGSATAVTTTGTGGDYTPAIVWVGTVATNIFYIPAKCVYAAFGGITGGLGWLLTGGNTEAANGIWYPTIYGTYVVTPAMLQGKEDCRFRGP